MTYKIRLQCSVNTTSSSPDYKITDRVNCELFIKELHLLATFTHKVTSPFLNCIEKSTQVELLKVFRNFSMII